MEESKSGKKKTINVNQKKATILPIDLQEILKQRAVQLFVLHGRLLKCIVALGQYGDVPDDIEMNDIAENYIKLKDAIMEDIRRNETRAAIELKTFEETLSIVNEAIKVNVDNPRVLQKLRYACYSLSIFYLSNNHEINYNNIKKYIDIENLLTGKSHDAIGYWTKKVKEKKSSQKGGQQSKLNKPILEATVKFLKNHPRLLNKSSDVIQRFFFSENDSDNEINVCVNREKYQIYCDGEKIIAEKLSNPKTYKTIMKSTFKTRYISIAKKQILTSK